MSTTESQSAYGGELKPDSIARVPKSCLTVHAMSLPTLHERPYLNFQLSKPTGNY